MNAGESLRDQGGQMPPVRARKHGPRAKNRRDGAPRGATHRKMRALKLLAAPLGAPSPSFMRGQEGQAHPAPSKKYGRRSVGCLTMDPANGGTEQNILGVAEREELAV